MNKSTIKTAFVTALVLVVGVICIFSFHNSFTDRLNPFISQETSYAQVDKGTQRYYNVKAYNPKTKKNLLLKKVGGYDPSGQYISIQHKGQYVKSNTSLENNLCKQKNSKKAFGKIQALFVCRDIAVILVLLCIQEKNNEKDFNFCF